MLLELTFIVFLALLTVLATGGFSLILSLLTPTLDLAGKGLTWGDVGLFGFFLVFFFLAGSYLNKTKVLLRISSLFFVRHMAISFNC